MTTEYVPVHLPLMAGLNTGTDSRALEPPELAVAKNVEFEKGMGLQTRKPYAALGGSVSDARRLVPFGDELLLFTKDTLYSWSARDSAWVSKGDYLAPTLSEATRFARSSEQTQCDRCEISGVALYTWVESPDDVYLAAADKTTGAVLLAPTRISGTGSRPRLVSLASVALLLYCNNGIPALEGLVIAPGSLAASAAATPTILTVSTSFNSYYDVVAVGSEALVAYRRNPTTSYGLLRLTSALSVTSSTEARVCDGPIAISASPEGIYAQVVRSDATDILGDLIIVSSLGSLHTDTAVGTASGTVNQIAAAHRSTQDDGEFRCYAFWSAGESPSSISFQTKSNWIDTAGDTGTEDTFIRGVGVGSRAFNHDGRVFVWLAFASESTAAGMGQPLGFRAQLQNSYFCYRDDGLLIAKAAMAKAGGFSQATGHLPNVQRTTTNVYAWCGVERRIIPLGGKHTGYSARTPHDIVLTFDSDDARRCVRLGETLYVAGAQLLQYDGEGLAEVGFHVFPWYFATIDGGAASTSPGKDAGDVTYLSTYSWPNAKGELDRSTTATAEQVTLTSGHKAVIQPSPLHVTLKKGDRSPVAVEIWGTAVDPGEGAPLYLVTSEDPSDSTDPNRYIFNEPNATATDTVDDELEDDELRKRQLYRENGGVLENLSPPACSIVAANQDRVFLGGVAGDPDRIWYSKLRAAGEVAGFHDALTIEIPPEGGAMTAIAFLAETLIVFRETAVYAVPGDGFDNAGGGQNYGPARRLSADCGAVSAEAVAETPAGLIFKSSKGWYVLTGAGTPEYIGANVSGFDDDEVVAVHVLEAQQQIRVVTTARMLVFDYVVRQWSEWEEADARTACIWNGLHHYATATAVKVQRTDYSGVVPGFDVELPWIKMDQLQGDGRIRWFMVLGEFRSQFRTRVRVAYNGDEVEGVPVWVDDKYFLAETDYAVGAPLQFRHGPKRHRCTSIKVRLTAVAAFSSANPTGEAARLTGISFEVGVSRRGLYRGLKAAQKQ